MRCAHGPCPNTTKHARRYCSPECHRASMDAQRKDVTITCKDCGKPEEYKGLPAHGQRPHRCRACQREARAAESRRCYRLKRGLNATEVLEVEAAALAVSLRESRQRLLCEFGGFRLQVRRLAVDLGLGIPAEVARGAWGFGLNFAALGLCVTLSRVALRS